MEENLLALWCASDTGTSSLSGLGSDSRSTIVLTSESGSSGCSAEGVSREADAKGEVDAHTAGTCRPCHFMKTKMGCRDGDQCIFCHRDHVKPTRSRPSQNTRRKVKRVLQLLEGPDSGKLAEIAEAANTESARGRYMQSILRRMVKNMPEPDMVSSSGPEEKESEESTDDGFVASL
eukprot:NODE_17886_length_921_cov_4.562972.p1 GENE.NODE_17886_length_921_cov_4.562972~~NODE_17886_length_921_cov_4.562972.p1  ORF type:complete len:177 (+),score=37.12 NODE_17886_length_921_cov_4.562972:83-613(+)